MRTVHKYIAQDFMVTFLMTLMIFTFVMYIGAVVKVIDLMARGISGGIIFKVFLYNIPYILSFSIPISVVTAVLLLFSRLSFDGEVTAMKASGLSMWQISSSVILVSALLSLFCIYVNAVAAPNSHFARRQMLSGAGVADPSEMLEEGRWVRDLPGLVVYVGKKDGSRVEDIHVYEMSPHGVKRSIRAEKGEVTTDKEKNEMVIDLYNVRIEEPPDPGKDASYHKYINTDHYVERLDLSQVQRQRQVRMKKRDRKLSNLLHVIQHVEEEYPDQDEEYHIRARSEFAVEAHTRMAMSVSCFAFTLLGIPLGMTSRRKESSVGIAMSLAVVFVFYFFVVIAEALTDRPELHPEFIIWIPIILCEVIGFWLIRKLN